MSDNKCNSFPLWCDGHGEASHIATMANGSELEVCVECAMCMVRLGHKTRRIASGAVVDELGKNH